MRRLTGEQRLRQIRRKVAIQAARQVREYMAGRLPWLPCSGDAEQAAIIAEFDRVYRMGVEDGRATPTTEDKGREDRA